MSVRVQSSSTAATGTWSAMPKLRSRSEKRSPPSTASEPTTAPATTRASASASRSRCSRTASRCSTVNTRHESIAAGDPAACRAAWVPCQEPAGTQGSASQVLNFSTEPALSTRSLLSDHGARCSSGGVLAARKGPAPMPLPDGRQGETWRERVLPFSCFPVPREIRRYWLVDTLFAVRSANYARALGLAEESLHVTSGGGCLEVGSEALQREGFLAGPQI